MAQLIPSPPLGADPNSYVWIDWYNQITVVIDQLNDLLQQVNTTANNAISAAQDAQDAADAAQITADAAALSATNAATAANNAQLAAEDAQDAADLAQAAAVTAQEAAALAQSLAIAAQEQANESLSPDTYNASTSAGSLLLTSGTASAEVRYNNNGTKDRRINGGSYIGNGNWYSPTTTSIGDTHWIRFTKVSESGGTITGTFNTWTQLLTAQSLSISRSILGEAIGVISVEIATDSSGTTIVATGTATITAIREN